MSRAVLIAWLPWFGCLLAAFAALWLVLRFSGARLAIGKLRRLHGCEAGSVQTLSFVLTLPLFIMLLMFIVQVADLMIAIGVIHYAAFAAARSAIVWLPANYSAYEPANTLGTASMETRPSPPWLMTQLTLSQYPSEQKYNKIWTTAMLNCAPLSPSYDLEQPSKQAPLVAAVQTVYPTLVPNSSSYPRIRNLIAKKISYSGRNTWIVTSGVDRDATGSDANGKPRPTYNPYPGHYVLQPDPNTGQMTKTWIPWNPLEIGWEDPVTVAVFHKYALMPGPGRFLATVLTPGDGTVDQVSPLVQQSQGQQGERYDGGDRKIRLYYIVLTAAVTMSNEGLKSVMPYAPPMD
ncbi:MAG TPA: hypothetical protein VL475_04135 [Planctomycetaceae bacterium]|nr:hypothetical protein [Planctomycetaceae bacterium]